MTTLLRLLGLAGATVALVSVSACTNGYAVPIPKGDGYVAGGGGGQGDSTPVPAPDAGSAAPVGGGWQDAGSSAWDAGAGNPGSGSGQDAGNGSALEAGVPTGFDAAPPITPPTQGPLGSCGNPACGTDLDECGCQATDSNGNTVQMGCQAGGQCICLVNQNPVGNAFDENGACGAQSSTVQQFLADCTCQ
jgi:hypothetical protein